MYMSLGCMVVKIGVQKSDSLNPTVYNPLYNPTKKEGSSLSVPKSMLIDGSSGYVEPLINSKAVDTSMEVYHVHIITSENVRRSILTAT